MLTNQEDNSNSIEINRKKKGSWWIDYGTKDRRIVYALKMIPG